MPKTIVAIGGGEITKGETLSIDKRIIELTGKIHPQILFIPTASSDSERYCQDFYNYFEKELGCKVSFLKLCADPPSHAQIQKTILGADAIYVGGGNTLKMMKLWRRLGVDTILKKAWEKGIVLSGTSAGAICWFEAGHSDSMSFYKPQDWTYIRVKGLGFLKGTLCPHYNSGTNGVPRKEWFAQMMRKVGGTGIAIDEECAIEYSDDSYRVLRENPKRGAYAVSNKNGKINSEEIA